MNKKMGIVIAIALVVITVAFFALKGFSQAVETGDNELYTQKICTLPGNMVRVEINDKGLTTRLEKEGDKWKNLEYEELVYDDWSFHLWLTDIRNVIGEKIESSSDVYDESTIITIYDEMNNSQTFKVGIGKNKDSNMYVDTDDIDGVYVIPNESKSVFNQNINEFVVNTINIPNIEIAQEISIQSKKTSTFKKQKDEWIIEDYYTGIYRGDNGAVDKLLSDIGNIKIKDYEGIITEENDYGMSNSKLKITIDSKNTLTFGDINQNKIYVSIDDNTPFVYSVPYLGIKQFESIDMFNLLNREVIDISVDSKNEIILENPQGKYVFQIGYEDTKSESLPEEQVDDSEADNTKDSIINNELDIKENYNIMSKLNDKEITKEEVEELVELINSSVYLEVVLQHPGIEQKEDRPAEATIIFTNSMGATDKIELIPYDINYYLLRMNGSIEFAVNKDKITTLFNKLNTLAN